MYVLLKPFGGSCPWEHMCLGKTRALGEHMPWEHMCHDLYCETVFLFSVCFISNKCNGKTCALGKYVPW